MKRTLIIFLTVFLCTLEAGAKIWLPGLYSDYMLLQQDSEIEISGRADGKTLRITVSWSPEVIETPIVKGVFAAKVHTPKASYTNHSMILEDENSSKFFNDILVGDVWVCSGQSNMEMTMRGFSQQPVSGAMDAVLESGKYKDRIRILRVGRYESEKERTTIKGRWEKASPAEVLQTSAMAYFYAKYLNDATDIPIGVITASRSSSKIEAWMPQDVLASEFGYDVQKINSDPNIRSISKCGLYYNGMLAPLSVYAAKGFLWYQGESNRDEPDKYPALMASMVRTWRKIWKNDQMPFIFVQIAPYSYNNDNEAVEVPLFVESQIAALKLIPRSAIVANTDCGEEKCIHPSSKSKVASRAAVEALKLAYGYVLPDASGMKVKSAKRSGKTVEVTFDNAEYGIVPMSENIEGFELAGKDGVFHKAQANAVKGKPAVSVSCTEVVEPCQIRYAYHNVPVTNMKNTLGYPAYPFRLDLL